MSLTFEDLVAARWRQAHDDAPDPEQVLAVLSLATAAGAGAVLPISVLRLALADDGERPDLPRVRDTVVRLGALLTRDRPGRPDERVGLAHLKLVDLFQQDTSPAGPLLQSTHRRLATLLDALTQPTTAGPLNDNEKADLLRYATLVGAQHHIAATGMTATAVELLSTLDGPRAADNVTRWQAWQPALSAEAGPDHPDTLTTRHNIAYWRGEAGDPAGAATALEALLTDMLRVLGADHPDTLTTRGNLASWRGQAGDPAGAATALEALLTDRLRVLGPDHPDTLTTRHNIAHWRREATQRS